MPTSPPLRRATCFALVVAAHAGLAWAAVELARQRAAIDSAGSGTELAQIVQALTADGFEVGGDQVATRPRGVPADHPRLDLMRRQSLVVLKTFGEPAWLPTADVVERVAEQWARITPLVEWLVTNVGPSLEPRR